MYKRHDYNGWTIKIFGWTIEYVSRCHVPYTICFTKYLAGTGTILREWRLR